MKLLIENFRKFLEEEVGGFTTPYQLFVPTGCDDGACSIDELKNTPPIENRPGINKPFGGLWTSTAWEVPYTKGSPKGMWTSEWNEWLPGNMPHWMSPQGILIVPKTDNIFHVSTEEDAAQLYEEFPAKTEEWSPGQRTMLRGGKHIDFESALKKYDGIHYGAPSGKDSGAWNFGPSGGWDVESTVFRDTSVVDLVKVVPVKQADEPSFTPFEASPGWEENWKKNRDETFN